MRAFVLASACLAASGLAGCQSTGGASPGASAQTSVLNSEKQAFSFACPTIQSGALDPVAATFNAGVQQAYADAKAICNVGAIRTPGQFAADFLIVEPILTADLGNVKISF
jgi:hypothetical protein